MSSGWGDNCGTDAKGGGALFTDKGHYMSMTEELMTNHCVGARIRPRLGQVHGIVFQAGGCADPGGALRLATNTDESAKEGKVGRSR